MTALVTTDREKDLIHQVLGKMFLVNSDRFSFSKHSFASSLDYIVLVDGGKQFVNFVQ